MGVVELKKDHLVLVQWREGENDKRGLNVPLSGEGVGKALLTPKKKNEEEERSTFHILLPQGEWKRPLCTPSMRRSL